MKFFGHIILSDALEVVKPVDPLIELRGSASGSPVELPEDGFLSLQLVDFLARDVRSLHHPTGVVVTKVAMHEGLEDPGLSAALRQTLSADPTTHAEGMGRHLFWLQKSEYVEGEGGHPSFLDL